MSEQLKTRLVEAMQREVPIASDRLWSLVEPHCESPIEVALGVALLMGMGMICAGSESSGITFCKQVDEQRLSGRNTMLLMPQYHWGGYRIDWVIKFGMLRQPYIFIECDGHDFHERTADQAVRDRSRDRAVQEADIPILRYTGREIYRDVQACASQVMDMCVTLVDRHQ